ncbi:hemolysin secretion protein D [Geotalea uraniireducens]|uniref:Hemolysin secretion protein D n=1 Tax=Geotalea uraniireducens TaxID=351604 RepID=A0ABM8EKF5_9BACT|nr:efflux RND transporter periplasmic adaptor subunit [Geotalea uraniireducens]BDV42478.1 hemolysin secretion protein D [Geotalea uraniireducens]
MANDDLGKLKIDKTAAFRPTGRRRKKFWLVVAAVVLVLIALAASGVFTPAVEIEAGTVSQVFPYQTFTLLNASGYVVAQRKAAVAAKLTGRLDWLGVEEGSRVRRGQILARLENQDAVAARAQAAANLKSAEAQLEQARAELNDATLSFNRQKQLLKDGIIAKADYDSAEARFLQARGGVDGAQAGIRAAAAALRGAEVNVEYSYIRAPFNAVVLTKDADVGDIVTPIGAAADAKAAVVTIADLGSLQVEADVSESNLEKVKMGQPCVIQLDALPEAKFPGVVHMIVPTADRSKATVMVKVRFLTPDPRILPEMSARVAFLDHALESGDQTPRTAVPPTAVAERGGRRVAFVVAGQRVSERPVTVGARIGDMVEIKSGLKAGERIALKPVAKLNDGSKIKIVEP